MSAQANDIMTIGEYQLRNLQNARTPFYFFDLSATENKEAKLTGSERVTASKLLTRIRELRLASDAPIVLICETGSNSMAAASELAQNSFINVFVVEGGINSLAPKA